jgi:hypothetical protein
MATASKWCTRAGSIRSTSCLAYTSTALLTWRVGGPAAFWETFCDSKDSVLRATGYTGKLVSEQARYAGLDFALAGRNEEKVGALALRRDDPMSFPF